MEFKIDIDTIITTAEDWLESGLPETTKLRVMNILELAHVARTNSIVWADLSEEDFIALYCKEPKGNNEN